MPEFRYESILDHPRDQVFRWHTRPGAFERLAPPWVDVRVLERVGGIDGGHVLLEVRRGLTRFRWAIQHTGYRDQELFVDQQASGPFKSWTHTHSFMRGPEGGTVVRDVVEWELPMGGIATSLGKAGVERELRRLFAFRHARLRSDLARHRPYSNERPLKVAISGASGLIGSSLAAFLTSGGHEVVGLVRSRDRDGIYWNPEAGMIDGERLRGLDAVVHLAGEPISSFRWSAEKKEKILKSRVRGTELLSRAIADLPDPPPVLVSASGIGVYGSRGNQILTEDGGPGRGFLAEVCRQWEAATRPAEAAGIRVVRLRLGMVLSAAGGALATMLPAFKLGAGGRLGAGKQYMSWIDLDDVIGLIHHIIRSPKLSGPVNATAPHPVTNSGFADALGRTLRRPTIFPVPSLAIRALFGEMGTELLLTGSRVIPEKASHSGFEFHHDDLESSLRFQLGKEV